MEQQKSIFLLLLPLITVFFACQNQDHAYKVLSGDDLITLRDECDECDELEDCCCFVMLYEDDAATVEICGSTTGGSECQASIGACGNEIDGTLEVISLGSTNPKQIFCMNPETAIRITNLSPTDNAGIRVGCNTTSILPLEYDLAPQDSVKAESNSSCELADCSS